MSNNMLAVRSNPAAVAKHTIGWAGTYVKAITINLGKSKPIPKNVC
jgi:hypothetical protein